MNASRQNTKAASRQIRAKVETFAGFSLRAAVVWLLVVALLLFIADAFSFPVSFAFLALCSAFWVALFAGMSTGIWQFFAGLVLIGVLLYIPARSPNFLLVAQELWLAVQGVAVDKLLKLGYAIFELYAVTRPFLYYTQAQYLMAAFGILSFALSALLVPCFVKRVRFLLPGIVVFIVFLPIFTLNLPDSNWGFALIVCAICGLLVIQHFEKTYYKRKGARRKKPLAAAAKAGFAGFTATVLALSVIALPCAKITTPTPAIAFIDEPINNIRKRLTELLSGESEQSYLPPALWVPRSTEAQKQTYSDILLFTVRASFDTPVYLRGWIGMNYKNDRWELPDQSFITEYKKLFGETFDPDDLTYDYYSIIARYTPFNDTVDLIKFGARTQEISIRCQLRSEFLHIPAIVAGKIYGQDNRSVLVNSRDDNFFDGIFLNPSEQLPLEYKAVTLTQTMQNPEFMKNIENGVIYLLYMRDCVRYYDDILRITEPRYHASIGSNIITEAKLKLRQNNIPFSNKGSILEDYINNPASRASYQQYFTLLDNYLQYAHQFYAQPSGSKLIRELALDIFSKIPKETLAPDTRMPGDFCTERHAVVMAVLNYLSNNMTYTLSPTKAGNARYNAIENFLFVTREGYCVQFATAAALLLRDLGIPVRYVEGYTTDTFSQEGTHYVGDIYDYNAHAWIEVYYDGYGWLKYEATTIYREGTYGQSGEDPTETTAPDTTDTPETLPSDTTEDPDPFESNTEILDTTTLDPTQPKKFSLSPLVPALLCAALLVILILLVKRRGDRALSAKQKLAEAIQAGDFDDSQINDYARKLSDYILNLFAAEGLTPRPGELQQDFARRLTGHFADGAMPSLATLFDYLAKAEFSTELEREELIKLCEYYRFLLPYIWRRLRWTQRLRCRYIRLTV